MTWKTSLLLAVIVMPLALAARWGGNAELKGARFSPWPDTVEYAAEAQSLARAGQVYLQIGPYRVHPRFPPGWPLLLAPAVRLGVGGQELWRITGVLGAVLAWLLGVVAVRSEDSFLLLYNRAMSQPLVPINLVLGGGGAKGFAHVGVICELVERGFEIRSIVGTSVGALIGALFAFNRSVRYAALDLESAQKKASAAIEQICIKEDFRAFQDVNLRTPFSKGLFKGRELEDWLRGHFFWLDYREVVRFSDLPFSLTITATNALNGDPVIFNKQLTPALALHKVVRASTSIPGVYPDAEVLNEGSSIRCWDGGLTGNCRFDLAYRFDSAPVTVASSLTFAGTPKWTELSSLRGWLKPWRRAAILDHMISIMMRRLDDITYEGLAPEERRRLIVLRPNVEGVTMLDFGLNKFRKRRLIDEGRGAVRSKLDTMLQAFGED